MSRKSSVIISCAVTGGIHTPTMSPHLPITPRQIAEQSITAAEAGASIIHLHARDPQNGRPTADPDVFMQFLPVIKQSSEAVVDISTGGGLEDSLYIGKGELARDNAQQVAKIRHIVEELSLTVATPAEARQRLGLKGGDRVGF